MIVKELAEKLNLKIAAGEKGLDREIRDGYCGDLLSDVMGKSPENCIWMTVQTHQNIVAVAVLKEMAAIVITGGHTPDKETQEKVIQFLNGEYESKLPNKFVHKDGMIYLDKDEELHEFILIRGWGSLTGTGSYNLDGEYAGKIQDTLAEYIVQKLNKQT